MHEPQKEMYGHFFERFGLKPEECYFIDDLPNNIAGAKACGMDGIALQTGCGKVKTHTLRICPFVIHSKSGLLRTCSFRLSPSNDCVSMQVSLPVSPVAVRDSYCNLKTFLIIYSKNIQTFPAIA